MKDAFLFDLNIFKTFKILFFNNLIFLQKNKYIKSKKNIVLKKKNIYL